MAGAPFHNSRDSIRPPCIAHQIRAMVLTAWCACAQCMYLGAHTLLLELWGCEFGLYVLIKTDGMLKMSQVLTIGQTGYLLAVWPGIIYVTSLCLSF